MGYTIWANAITFRAQNSKPLDSYIAGRPDLRETQRERVAGEVEVYNRVNGNCVKARLGSSHIEKGFEGPFTLSPLFIFPYWMISLWKKAVSDFENVGRTWTSLLHQCLKLRTVLPGNQKYI